jgi:hypothetical protein
LPADTNIDRITYNGLAASVSGVNYLQGPSASDLQEEYFSNERILNPNGYKTLILMNLH